MGDRNGESMEEWKYVAKYFPGTFLARLYCLCKKWRNILLGGYLDKPHEMEIGLCSKNQKSSLCNREVEIPDVPA